MVSGLIVGESLFNVGLAPLIVATGKGAPLALVGDSFADTGLMLAAAGIVVVTAALYLWTARRGARAG
jgi:hypothetical protein